MNIASLKESNFLKMKRQQKNLPTDILNLKLYLPVFTIAAVSFTLYFSEAYHPSWNYDWQGIRPEVRNTVYLLEDQWAIFSYLVGYAAQTTPQWYRQRWFMKNATTKELQKLISYPNSIVKTLSYEGLLRRKPKDHFNILSEIMRDTTRIDYLSGCIGNNIAMNEYLVEYRFFLGIIATTPPPPPGLRLGINLSEEEIKELKTIYQKANFID